MATSHTESTFRKNSILPITRRDFVKASGAAIVLPAFANRVHASHTETLRIGLIGCGGRGTGAAMQALTADPNTQLTAMGDAFGDKLKWSLGNLSQNEALKDRVHVDEAGQYVGLDSYQKVIDSGVDVVILATPPVFRPIQLQAAVDAGKHVFCEKPMAVDAPGVRSVLESAKKAKQQSTALMSGFCWRYSFPMRNTMKKIHDGDIGDIMAVQCTYNTGPLADVPREEGMTDMEWQLRNWKAFNWASGDHIVEQAVHAIDWIPWALQHEPPTRAYAVGGRIAREGEWTGNMYDHFGVFFEYANGRRAYHMCRQIAGCANDNTAHVIGTNGTANLNPWNPTLVISMNGEETWRWKGQKNDMYQTEHDELFESIRKGEPINDGEWMAHSTLMGILGRECAYTGQTIKWDEMLNSEKSLTPPDLSFDAEIEFPEVPVPGRES